MPLRVLPANWLLITLIVAAVCSSFFVVGARSSILERVEAVELVVDYEGAARLCHRVGQDIDAFLARAAAAGATSVGLRGLTVNELEERGRLRVLSGPDVIGQIRLGLMPELPVRAESSYLALADAALAGRLADAAGRLFGPDNVALLSAGDLMLVEVPASAAEVLGLQLSLVDHGHEDAGLSPVLVIGPAPRRVPGASLVLVEEAAAAGVPGGKALIHAWTVPGYPQYAEQLGRTMAAAGWQIGVFENRSQRGIEGVLAGADYEGFRVRLITPDDRPGSLALAATDRQIRMFYIEPALGTRQPEQAVEQWLSFIERAHAELAGAGFQVGATRGFPLYRVPVWALVLAGLGTVAAGCVGYGLIRPGASVPAAGLIIVLAAGGLAAAAGYPAREAMALVAAMVAAALGPILAVRLRWPVLASVLLVAVVAVAGGLLITTLLGDTAWALKVRQFRGVKPAYIIPPLLVGLAAVASIADQQGVSVPGLVRSALVRSLRLWWLGLVAVVAVGAVLYVGRSGHTFGIPVSAVEVTMRNVLELILATRPRTKEFLVGYPALVLGLTLLRMKSPWGWLWLLAGTVAPVSVVNSFSHLHTPVWQSILRSGLAVVPGSVLGLALWWLYSRVTLAVGGSAGEQCD